MTAVIIPETNGLSTHSNDLAAPVGSTSVADNVVFSREGRPERRTGFKDYSTNIPDFEPQQLIASAAGDQAYMHLDDGIWYSSSGTWYRKRGAFGTSLSNPLSAEYAGGHVYVATGDNVILDINLATGTRTVLAGRFGAADAHTDGTGDAARFSDPNAIVVVSGNLYVAETTNHCIRKIVLATGVVTTFAGTTTTVSGHVDAVGTAARFSNPSGICSDGTNLYVADESNHAIRKIVISSATVSTIAGTIAGVSGFVDAVGTAARFTSPRGICCDATNIYLTEAHDIRKIVISSATVSTIAGLTSFNSFADGTGTAGRFDSPRDIEIVGSDLYVADSSNEAIRKIVVSTGVVTTPFGTGVAAGHVDGIGAAARFYGPRGISTDGTNLYVADEANDAIRKIHVPTAYSTTIDGVSGVNASSSGLPLANGIFVGPD